MDRRVFLRLMAGAGAAGVMAGCGNEPAEPGAGATAAASPPAAGSPAVARVAPDADPVLNVISASYEQLTGTRPFAFGLVGPDNTPVTGADAELWVVPQGGTGEPAGPFTTTYHEVEGQPLGLYVTEVELTEAGPTSFVAVTGDGRAGADDIQVATPESSQIPAPGQEAVAVATPTEDKPLGFEKICTLDPPCGMHDISLDDALAKGRPVVLAFATPAFCQTAVCGPSVGVVEEVRTTGAWGDVAFIHCEIFTDAGQTVAKPVKEWKLPSEPWLFTIDADGRINNRSDGPLMTLEDQVENMVQAVA
ncbi:MAG: hypothetical protein GEU74_10185 [Nitriliruptorales bacterium]|nr:hypothetical protein [Nitriliruptorales bacterium]